MAPGQKRCQHSEVQICLLLPEHDCGPVIGKRGSRITTYHQETGCQVFVHNDYRQILAIKNNNQNDFYLFLFLFWVIIKYSSSSCTSPVNFYLVVTKKL